MNKVVIAVIGAAASIGLAIGVGVVIPSGPTYTTVSIPASYGGHTIASDCTSDATPGLDAFFASLTTPTVVNMATNGCYSVSPNSGDLFTVDQLTNIIVNGNGSTFSQPSYQETVVGPDGPSGGSSPPSVASTCSGTCATTWKYEVTALGQISGESAATFGAGSTTSGPAALSGTDYNTISWSARGGAASYNVYRYNGTAYVLIGNSATTSFADTGQTATSQNPPVTGNALATGCGTNTAAPVVWMYSDTGVTFNDLTVKGPVGNGGGYDCQGNSSEGDNGIYVGNWASNDGSTGLTFNGVTVENVNGDALDLYPHLSDNTGVNSTVVFENGALSNWGWYGIVPEGIDGLNFTGNTVTGNNGRFLDAEVDNSCGMGSGQNWANNCLNGNGGLAGDGIWNMAIVNNTFPTQANIEGLGPQGCIPEKNWTIANNTAPNGLGVQLDGSEGNTDCPNSTEGFTFTDNTGNGVRSVCGGSGCAGIGLDAWANVTISNNNLTYYTGTAGSVRTVTDGVVTSGSPTITSATANFTSADTCGAVNGCYINGGTSGIAGGGIPVNAYISAVTNSTTATISQNATASGTGVTLQIGQEGISPNQFSTYSVGLCSVTNASVTHNTFDGGADLWDTTHCDDTSNSSIVTTGVTTCGNTWGLTNPFAYWVYNTSVGGWTDHAAPAANPQTDTAC